MTQNQTLAERREDELHMNEITIKGLLNDLQNYLDYLTVVKNREGFEALARTLSRCAGASGPIGSIWEQLVAEATRYTAQAQGLQDLKRLESRVNG